MRFDIRRITFRKTFLRKKREILEHRQAFYGNILSSSGDEMSTIRGIPIFVVAKHFEVKKNRLQKKLSNHDGLHFFVKPQQMNHLNVSTNSTWNWFDELLEVPNKTNETYLDMILSPLYSRSDNDFVFVSLLSFWNKNSYFSNITSTNTHTGLNISLWKFLGYYFIKLVQCLPNILCTLRISRK